MLGFSFGIAGSFSLGSMVANLISPVALTASRFALAAVLIAIIVSLNFRITREHTRGLWRYGVGGILMSVYFVLMFVALQTATPVSISTIFTLTPLLSGLFGWILLRQVMTRSSALALAIGALGAVWVIFRGDLDAMLALRIGVGEMVERGGEKARGTVRVGGAGDVGRRGSGGTGDCGRGVEGGLRGGIDIAWVL